jgi:hypothetical protein
VSRRLGRARFEVALPMCLGMPDEVMRPLVPVLCREDLRSDGAKCAHDLAMQPAMPRDHVSSRTLMPLLINPAVLLMRGPTGGPHLVRSARDRLHLPLLPEQDVRESVLVGPVLARPSGALSETRHGTVEPAARQRAHRPVEGVVFHLHAAHDALARMPDRRHGTLSERRLAFGARGDCGKTLLQWRRLRLSVDRS